MSMNWTRMNTMCGEIHPAIADVIYEKECYEIVGASMDVHNVLGQGFLETVYQDALALEVSDRQLPFTKKSQLNIHYKAAYFRGNTCRLCILQQNGLLVNFGSERLKYKRLVM